MASEDRLIVIPCLRERVTRERVFSLKSFEFSRVVFPFVLEVLSIRVPILRYDGVPSRASLPALVLLPSSSTMQLQTTIDNVDKTYPRAIVSKPNTPVCVSIAPFCSICKKAPAVLRKGSTTQYTVKCADCRRIMDRAVHATVRNVKRSVVEMGDSENDEEPYTMKEFKRLHQELQEYRKAFTEQFEHEMKKYE